MQRGRVEGQEIPVTDLPLTTYDRSNSSSTEPEEYRHDFLNDYDQKSFQMPDVRLAATGDGGGGDGSSGSEESGNDGGVSTIPLPVMNIPTTYEVLRGLGIVGTGETSPSPSSSGGTGRLSPVSWSMALDRQEALDAMESSCPAAERLLDSLYLRNGAGIRRPQNLSVSHLQGTQGSFHLSQFLAPQSEGKKDDSNDEDQCGGYDDEVDEPDGARPSFGIRGGPCGNVTGAEALGSAGEDDENFLSTSLEPKYFSQSFLQPPPDSDDGWNHCPDNPELEFQQGADADPGVVYQNEKGQWVTDLAYYSSFEKELDGKTTENDRQFQTEDFVPFSDALEKIAQDQEEFEKQHQFMQEEKIEPASGNTTFSMDSSWKIPASSHILMRASQVSSEFQQGNQNYLRLSLGQFFGQRSEALGSLGSADDVDVIKRPSFGYIITSPEKREPFALIHPSELLAKDVSPQNNTTDLSEADQTLNPEDLDKTLEEPGERMPPKGDASPEPSEQKDPAVGVTSSDQREGCKAVSSLGDESVASPDTNSSHLMLSISTIASAIADASVSTDPSQLAAMIMELTKRSRPRTTGPGVPAVNGTEESPSANHGVRSTGQLQQDQSSVSPEKKASLTNAVTEHVASVQAPPDPTSDMLKGLPEVTQCSFRPSTSPLTHSSPSQTSIPHADGPSISRLTYISMNDATVVPTPERKKNNTSMALSTTIIRFSPTPPVEPDVGSNVSVLDLPKNMERVHPQHSKSLDPIPVQQCKSPEPSHRGSALGCSRSQSECNFHHPGDRSEDLSSRCRNRQPLPEPGARQLLKADSGYSSNINIQHTGGACAPQSSQQWGAAGAVSSSVHVGGLGMPPPFSSEGFHYVPFPSFTSQRAGLMDLPHQGDIQPVLTRRPHFDPQLAQQYLGSEAASHPSGYHVGATGSGLFGVSSTGIHNNDLTARLIHPPAVPLVIPGAAAHFQRPHQSQPDLGVMGKPFSHCGAEPLVTGQVVVPEELRFAHACCVGIASQTSLSLFNPSERWQQVSISVTGLAIDGEKVESSPYQWLIVKNKTIIGPKTTEEQKVLFIPPQAGIYQCVLSVCSWPASAETEVAARANIFSKRVVLVAIAENPTLEVEDGKCGGLDFGDLPEGSAKCLPLKLLNRSHATVPIRLVISANATAWRCFTLSKQPGTMTSAAVQPAGHVTPVSPPAVMNHVMHASYNENPQSFMVWVHFKAPQKFSVSSGELGPADEYAARVDIEVDSPGPSHVIKSIPLRARCGTARVHAPKDLQTVSLSAPLGKSSQAMLPLKNAGNIDVQLKLKHSDADDGFSVSPDELYLRVGEEKSIMVLFKPQGSKTCQQSLLTILVLPSGPQYEVTLKGEIVPEDSGKPSIPSAALCGHGVTSDVPPILSNKQFVAWGGVTLGRAIQQKLVLRNNSTNTTQQLRLLIRGQDQDCFQLQSMFSPEERLTRHGELSIRPGEDVTVHLLFAPTRVACMLAKLEIKQSGVRPSQPGVKFTIPLSGYGGTSNIILEDQRKQADGYMAKMADIAVGHVSKVCLCVRNTGSRAAFIKAVAFSDLQSRSVVEPSVISLAPSQFVLKERTQEVITVLMKSTEREENLCRSADALLATLCLLCGDEVSRQQCRRLLQSKPDAARRALSENSLLKNIDFNEKFLGEENITETYDLPHRPNEAHLFYGNMSKIVVSLMGSTRSSDCEQSSHSEQPLPSVRPGPGTGPDRALPNGNVSLDVLPVKGPQGPALSVTEPPLKAAVPLHRHSESWTIHPEQLVLAAPTINGAANTSQVQIQNNTSRELSFDLSWPAHCLTITPQHGVIEPQRHLQILISPNPSLATKSALLPWSGQVYVLCDDQQKLIKVQIRRDLALDVSAAPADTSLAVLPPQAATPVLPVARLPTSTTLPPETPPGPQALVEISSRTVVFPTTLSGETSEAQLEVRNGDMDVRWYLSSFAPPYVKGVDNTGDVYRATYTAFRCSKVFSGTLGAQEKTQVPITFLPRDRGDYAQFWDLECHPLSEPQEKTRIRLQLCGTGVKAGPVEGPQEGDCSLVKTEPTVKTRKRPDASSGRTGQEEAGRRGMYAPQELYTFPATRVGESSTLKVNIRNNSSDMHELTFVNPREPFHIKHSKYSLRSQHYLKLPVQFKPTAAGGHAGLLLIHSETGGSLVIQLTGEALP
ncbi:centrosomal protein of 192 kDa [Antennarius striatus]|uniref:centrosomal protein of 192 kDa n=1 Tax=Antennarius striatus TaxID=241820 RepID=UPI0035B448C9